MTGYPNHLTISPKDAAGAGGTSFDLLSQVLARIHLTGEDVTSMTLSTSWSLDERPDIAHLVVLTRGKLAARAGEDHIVTVNAGDLLMFPKVGGWALSPQSTDENSDQGSADIIVSRFRFDPDSLPSMIDALPNYMHVRKADGAQWLEGLAHFLLAEAEAFEPGASLMISRLIDLMVIRTIRHWVHQGQGAGWLGGLADHRIARVLRAIHAEPFKRWTIDELAGIAAMSRSSLSDHFATLVGVPPLRYHNRWRLLLARDLILGGTSKISDIALQVGYESDAAFSRAFKNHFGHAPNMTHAQTQ